MNAKLDGPELLDAVEAAMEQAASAQKMDLYFELQDVRGELARCLCHGLVATAVFEPWEAEYQRAEQLAAVDLPAAIAVATRLLDRIGGAV